LSESCYKAASILLASGMEVVKKLLWFVFSTKYEEEKRDGARLSACLLLLFVFLTPKVREL
jgi:hypothetical protein